ncbi:MAG: hypothetical protein WCA31_03115, partial [Acidimicrobiales bacterium]
MEPTRRVLGSVEIHSTTKGPHSDLAYSPTAIDGRIRIEFGTFVNVYVYVGNGDHVTGNEIPLSSEKSKHYGRPKPRLPFGLLEFTHP